jgi:predicted Zn-dependent protease
VPSFFPENLWKKFGMQNKITSIIKKNSAEIYEEIRKLKFDFAYIDGSHETEAERNDFEFMKTQCGRIIADDTDDARVFGIFSPSGAQRVSFRFAVWMANGDYSIVDEIKKDLVWNEPYGKLDFRHLEGL